MRKLFATFMLLVASTAATAQYTGEWVLTPVVDHHRDLRPVVGFIYQTAAQGTVMGGKYEKAVTKLELVCSATSKEPPVVILFWDRLIGNIPQMIDIKVDGKMLERSKWQQDQSMLIRPIAEAAQLMQAMKTGKSITFDWLGNDGVRRVTMFDLRSYNTNLSDFNKNCNL